MKTAYAILSSIVFLFIGAFGPGLIQLLKVLG